VERGETVIDIPTVIAFVAMGFWIVAAFLANIREAAARRERRLATQNRRVTI